MKPPLPDWDKKSVLVTGGTGSFGRHFVESVLREAPPRRLIVFSRDELKQHEMRCSFPDSEGSPVRYFIGDVRDRDRLYRALDGVDVVVHAAALKQVPTCEYNPLETVKTNILGAANLIDAAIDRSVGHVIALSSDKAANPINLYGATKLCADKLFVAANRYSGRHKTRFSIVRYGNVLGSRGSVVPLFLRARETGEDLPITDERMTRFWLDLKRAVSLVFQSLSRMDGGEIYVPRIPSMKIVDVARAIAPECGLQVVGIRPGEKLHEVLIPSEDARFALECGDHFVILPPDEEFVRRYQERHGGRRCSPDFCYSSDANDEWLTPDQLLQLAGVEAPAHGSAGD